jgi:hypothetical protein
MELTLEVNEVTPGSYTKGDKTYKTLDLLCTDKSAGRRLTHAVLFSPKPEQHEALLGADLRDKRITVEVHEIKTNFGGAVVFRGMVMPGSLPPAGGKLSVEKPANK